MNLTKIKQDKKALSSVVMTVLLILLAVTIAGIIYYSSKAFIQNMQKDSAIKMAREQCSKKFNIELSACYRTSESKIYMDLINLKETIPSGSSILLDNKQSKVIVPLVDFNAHEIEQGYGTSLEVQLLFLDLNEFKPETIKFVPVFVHKEERVLCNDFPEIVIKPCP